MANKYLAVIGGLLKQIEALVASAGVGDAGKIIATDATGKLDLSLLPTGVGAETKLVASSENLAAGDFVNIYDNLGTANVRKADASSPAKFCNGFVLAATLSGVNASVYLAGINNQVAGLVAGRVFLADAAPGGCVAVAPVTAGHIVQEVGSAISATEVAFQPKQTIELA